MIALTPLLGGGSARIRFPAADDFDWLVVALGCGSVGLFREMNAMSDTHDHSHSHDHTHGDDETTLSVQLANQIINVANSRLEDGMAPGVIAAGMRHAAANFSAFVFHRSGGGGEDDLSAIVGDFLQAFEYYLDRHAPGAPEPAGGLNDLIERAKQEI